MSAENSDSTDDDLSNSGESTLSTDKEPVSPGHNPTFSGLPGQVVELVVEKWVQNGLGISHKENHIFFVHGALPGETVRARVVKGRSAHSFAVVEEVLEASSERQISECPVFPACGGCSYRHISYDREVELKLSLLKEHKFLSEHLDRLQAHTGPRNGYRNQVRLHESSGSRGFFGLHTNEVVALPEQGCLNLSSSLNERIFSSKDLELRDDSLSSNSISLPGLDFAWRFPEKGFVQANRYLIAPWLEIIGELCRDLFSKLDYADEKADSAAEKVKSRNGEANSAGRSGTGVATYPSRVFELFAGAGLIGGFLLLSATKDGRSKELDYLGAESHGPSIDRGKANFRAAGLKGRFLSADLYRGNVAEFLKSRFPAPDSKSLLVVNPPRAGLKQNLCKWIHESGFKRLIYSSCNPQTLDRDLGMLQRDGFRVRSIHWLDFFPGTPHSEMVLSLERT